MSYQHVVINDKPILYYPLNDSPDVLRGAYGAGLYGTGLYGRGTGWAPDVLRGAYGAGLYGTGLYGRGTGWAPGVAYEQIFRENGIYNNASVTVTNPIVSNSVHSQLISSSDSIVLSPLIGIWNENYPNQSFCLEFWVSIVDISSPITLFTSNQGDTIVAYDNGIQLNIIGSGTTTLFGYISDWNSPKHVVINFDGNSFYIWIDGNIVNQVEFLDTFVSGNRILSIGDTAGTIKISSVAIYQNILLNEQIINHFASGRENSFEDYISKKAAVTINLDDSHINEIQQLVINDYNSFVKNALVNDNLIYSNGYIKPVDVTLDGNLQFIFTIDFGDNLIDPKTKIEWSGSESLVVNVSLDGTTWAQADNKSEIPFSTSLLGINKVLVSVDFPNTLVEEAEPRLKEIKLVSYISEYNTGRQFITTDDANVNVYNTWPLYLIGKELAPLATENATELNEGNVMIDFSKEIYALEFMVKINSASSDEEFVFDATSTGTQFLKANDIGFVGDSNTTYYFNGNSAYDTEYNSLEKTWIHVVAVFDAPFSGQIYFGSDKDGNNFSDISIGWINGYYRQISPTEIERNYEAAFGITFINVPDGDTIAFSDQGFDTYSYNWQATGS